MRGSDSSASPGIVNPVVNHFLFVGFDLNPELDRLRVGLYEWIALFGNVPVVPAKHVLDHLDLGRFLLVIPELDIETFIKPMISLVDPIVGPLTFSG